MITINSGTFVVQNEIFVLPAGFRNADLNNDGANDAQFKGNHKVGGKSPVFIKLAAGTAYSLGIQNGQVYGEWTIDATNSKVEVSVHY